MWKLLLAFVAFAALAILAGASLYFGVFSGFPTGVASRAAAELMAGLP